MALVLYGSRGQSAPQRNQSARAGIAELRRLIALDDVPGRHSLLRVNQRQHRALCPIVLLAPNFSGSRWSNGSHFLQAKEARLAWSTSPANSSRVPTDRSALIWCHLLSVEQAVLRTLALEHSQPCLHGPFVYSETRGYPSLEESRINRISSPVLDLLRPLLRTKRPFSL